MGGPKPNLYFPLNQPPFRSLRSPNNRLSLDTILYSPPHPLSTKKNLLHRTGRISDHSEPTQNVNLSDIGRRTFEIGGP